MALVECSVCKKAVSDLAKVCPNCNTSLSEENIVNKSNESVNNPEKAMSQENSQKAEPAPAIRTASESKPTIKRVDVPGITIASYGLAGILTAFGFYKMLIYENPEFRQGTNVYVGGDAYNYIINANYATGYFVLAAALVIMGSAFLIKKTIEELNFFQTLALNELKHVQQNQPIPKVSYDDLPEL